MTHCFSACYAQHNRAVISQTDMYASPPLDLVIVHTVYTFSLYPDPPMQRDNWPAPIATDPGRERDRRATLLQSVVQSVVQCRC